MNLRQRWIRAAAGLYCAATFIGVAAEEVPASIVQCRNEADAVRRLHCYDQAVGRVVSADDGDRPINIAADASNFGVSYGPLAQQQAKTIPEVKQITAKLISVRSKPRGELVIDLDNNQVWEQLQPTSLRLRSGDTVTIKSGALGSYILVAPSGRGAKVKRVQ
ncbi:MAG: hypothetical protein H7Y02_09745 [Candidatus Obscuribacterales bacterium]|nr:hypothetical protein [Steroidobacteraceae bacterium]